MFWLLFSAFNDWMRTSHAGSFDLLVYTDQDAQVPGSWEESDPKYIQNSTEVKLRSFTTKVHKVDASVAYKNIGEEEEDV